MGRDVVELTAMVDAVCADLNKFCGELYKGIKQKFTGEPLQTLIQRGKTKLAAYDELLGKLEGSHRDQVDETYGHFIEIARGFLDQLLEQRGGS